jgi:hypothetical protein
MDAGGPSGEPSAERAMGPVNHARPETAFQARQKLMFIERETEDATVAIYEKVWSGQSHMCQRSAL